MLFLVAVAVVVVNVDQSTISKKKTLSHQQDFVDSLKLGERKLWRGPVSRRGLVPSRGGPLRGRGEAEKAEEARHFFDSMGVFLKERERKPRLSGPSMPFFNPQEASGDMALAIGICGSTQKGSARKKEREVISEKNGRSKVKELKKS